MKIKPIIKEENIYDIVRYNPNINNNNITMKKGIMTKDKKEYSTMVLLSLIYLSDIKDDDSTNFVLSAINKSKTMWGK